MHELINEPIDILVSFAQKANPMPLFFRWRNKRYKIDTLALIHKKRDGQDTIYYYNVTNKSNYFKLSFTTKNLRWHIEELYTEG